MEDYVFKDALAGSVVSCSFPSLSTRVTASGPTRTVRTLFFPGCSLINYGLPLVEAVYNLLFNAGCVEGISLLCCGKILSFEPGGEESRAAFEDQLREQVVVAGVERVVAACPNCVAALRAAFSADERTAGVEVVALPQELSALGYAIDKDIAVRMLTEQLKCTQGFYEVCEDDASVTPLLSVHDSCPDRATGEFADGVRALMPPELTVEPEHTRCHSKCCGSLLRAAGKSDVALEQSLDRGREAAAAGGSGMVTACASCSYLLSVSQRCVPVFHYLELLFDWRIDWYSVDEYMKLRFLLDEGADAQNAQSETRPFMGLRYPGVMKRERRGSEV